MKDPAFLFYTSDFLTGTLTMTDDQVGKYIRLLCLQHQKGRLTEKDMLFICKSYDFDIYSKFNVDDEKNYYNLRLETEIERRKTYSDSRRKNREGKTGKDSKSKKHMKKTSKRYDEHMENENENNNSVDNKVLKEKNWKNDFEIYKDELRVVFKRLMQDEEFIAKQERLNPGIDIRLTMEKACVNYWAKEAGWKHKKSENPKNIDWEQTLINSLSNTQNRVWKPKITGLNERRNLFE